jgi:NAD(P)-dependent dehydrogenase (short-subunit alcohol dehydrogenase family)
MISEPLRNPLSLFDVKDKVAIVTGASGTFGRATALALTALGGKVLLASGTKGELDEVAAEVRELGGDPGVMVRRPDSLADAQAMLDAALQKFGHVDQLVVASGFNKPGFIQDLEYEDWQAVMDANVRGIWFMAKAVGTYWIEKKVKGKVGARPARQCFRLHRLLHVEGRHRFADARAGDRMGQTRHHGQRDCANGFPVQAYGLDVWRQ